jgi:hypothetical protein
MRRKRSALAEGKKIELISLDLSRAPLRLAVKQNQVTLDVQILCTAAVAHNNSTHRQHIQVLLLT